jgi:hypothetical protein
MSFPSGDVVMTPFVGADDEIDGTVAPLQGSDFFEDVEGDYYDGLQNEDGEDRIATGSAVLHPCQTWGGMTDTALASLLFVFHFSVLFQLIVRCIVLLLHRLPRFFLVSPSIPFFPFPFGFPI